MICPLLTYNDLEAAVSHLEHAFGLTIVEIPDAVEIRWADGVAVAQRDHPADLHGSHVGKGWCYVAVDDPDAHYQRALEHGAHVLGEPHEGPGGQHGYSALDTEGNLWTFAVLRFGA